MFPLRSLPVSAADRLVHFRAEIGKAVAAPIDKQAEPISQLQKAWIAALPRPPGRSKARCQTRPDDRAKTDPRSRRRRRARLERGPPQWHMTRHDRQGPRDRHAHDAVQIFRLAARARASSSRDIMISANPQQRQEQRSIDHRRVNDRIGKCSDSVIIPCFANPASRAGRNLPLSGQSRMASR